MGGVLVPAFSRRSGPAGCQSAPRRAIQISFETGTARGIRGAAPLLAVLRLAPAAWAARPGSTGRLRRSPLPTKAAASSRPGREPRAQARCAVLRAGCTHACTPPPCATSAGLLRLPREEPHLGVCALWCLHLPGVRGHPPQPGRARVVCPVRPPCLRRTSPARSAQ